VADAGPNQSAEVNEQISFSGSGSSDPDGSIVSYQWNFGDGQSASGMNVSHSYSAGGTYTVTLTVTDNDDATDSDAAVVTVSNSAGGGEHLWSDAFSSGWDMSPKATATDGSGNVIVGGAFLGTVNFGGGSLSNPDSTWNDAFLVKFSSSGNHLWSMSMGVVGSEQAISGVAVDSNNYVWITGYFRDSINLGGGVLTSNGSQDLFIARYTSNGTHVWSESFGSTQFDTAVGIAVTSSNEAVIVGSHGATINLGGASLSHSGSNDFFMAKYSSNGSHIWSKSIGSSGDDQSADVDFDSAGNVVVTGHFSGSVNFGGTVLTSHESTAPFLAKYSSTGSLLWAQTFLSDAWDRAVAVAIAPDGTIGLTGYFYDVLDLGGGILTNSAGTDIFLATFSSSGAHIWSEQYGNGASRSSTPGDLTVDPNGNLVLGGTIYGAVTFGGDYLLGNGTLSAFSAKLTISGGHLWSKNSMELSEDSGEAVAADGSGNVFLTGTFSQKIDWGGSLFNKQGRTDMYLVKFAQ
jgi:PKD repeat protein